MKIFPNSKHPKNKPKQFRLTENNIHNLNYLSDITFRSETDIINDLLTAEGEKLKIVDDIDKMLGIYLSKQNPKTGEKYGKEEFEKMENELITKSREQNKTCDVQNISPLFVGYSMEPDPNNELAEEPRFCNVYFELKDKFALIDILEKFNWEYDNIGVFTVNDSK